jgi:hypothetical protein
MKFDSVDSFGFTSESSKPAYSAVVDMDTIKAGPLSKAAQSTQQAKRITLRKNNAQKTIILQHFTMEELISITKNKFGTKPKRFTYLSTGEEINTDSQLTLIPQDCTLQVV